MIIIVITPIVIIDIIDSIITIIILINIIICMRIILMKDTIIYTASKIIVSLILY